MIIVITYTNTKQILKFYVLLAVLQFEGRSRIEIMIWSIIYYYVFVLHFLNFINHRCCKPRQSSTSLG